MSVPKYKLYYFNIRARAEPARMVLAQAGVEYEDVRMTGEEWTKYKNGNNNNERTILTALDAQSNYSKNRDTK